MAKKRLDASGAERLPNGGGAGRVERELGGLGAKTERNVLRQQVESQKQMREAMQMANQVVMREVQLFLGRKPAGYKGLSAEQALGKLQKENPQKLQKMIQRAADLIAKNTKFQDVRNRPWSEISMVAYDGKEQIGGYVTYSTFLTAFAAGRGMRFKKAAMIGFGSGALLFSPKAMKGVERGAEMVGKGVGFGTVAMWEAAVTAFSPERWNTKELGKLAKKAKEGAAWIFKNPDDPKTVGMKEKAMEMQLELMKQNLPLYPAPARKAVEKILKAMEGDVRGFISEAEMEEVTRYLQQAKGLEMSQEAYLQTGLKKDSLTPEESLKYGVTESSNFIRNYLQGSVLTQKTYMKVAEKVRAENVSEYTPEEVQQMVQKVGAQQPAKLAQKMQQLATQNPEMNQKLKEFKEGDLMDSNLWGSKGLGVLVAFLFMASFVVSKVGGMVFGKRKAERLKKGAKATVDFFRFPTKRRKKARLNIKKIFSKNRSADKLSEREWKSLVKRLDTMGILDKASRKRLLQADARGKRAKIYAEMLKEEGVLTTEAVITNIDSVNKAQQVMRVAVRRGGIVRGFSLKNTARKKVKKGKEKTS